MDFRTPSFDITSSILSDCRCRLGSRKLDTKHTFFKLEPKKRARSLPGNPGDDTSTVNTFLVAEK